MTPALPIFRPTALALCTGVLFVAAGAGCADPSGQYNDFVERWDRIHATDAGELPEASPEASVEDVADAPIEAAEEPAPCDLPATSDVAPHYYVALSAVFSPTQPIMFLGTVTWDGTSLSLDFQPLDRFDHVTPKGDPVHGGPFTVAADGSFDADMGAIAVSGDANPISGLDIETLAQLHAAAGEFCKPLQFICGTVTGTVSKPDYLAGATLEGSTFTMTAMSSATAFPPGPVVIDCAGKKADY